MSYAGLYGPDETCEHDTYRKNCWKCNGTVERFAREYPEHLAHEQKLLNALGETEKLIKSRQVTVYDVYCPGCSLSRTFPVLNAAQDWLEEHTNRVEKVVREWRNSPEIFAEMRRRGIQIDDNRATR